MKKTHQGAESRPRVGIHFLREKKKMAREGRSKPQCRKLGLRGMGLTMKAMKIISTIY